MVHALPYRHVWSIDSLSRGELLSLLDSALLFKQASQAPDGLPRPLHGKYIAILSDDHASPEAAAFDRAASELGAQVAHVRATDPAARESRDPRDTAGLLGRLYDAIECQGMPPEQVQQIDRHAGVPVFNGIAGARHPLHVLADLMSLQERSGEPFERLRLRFAGDPRGEAGLVLANLADVLGFELVTGQNGSHASQATDLEIGCEPGGELPLQLSLHLGALPQMAGRSLVHEQARNRRCVLQAVLSSTVR
ncbi:MAG TPA: hypothetical protein VFV25_03200 [Methylibium sp.]